VSTAVDTAKSVAALGALTAVLPVNLAVTGAALAAGLLRPPVRVVAAEPRTILVSGGKMTKALQLCRSFHDAGHRVILVETAKYRLTGHRFSRAVDAFFVVPDPRTAAYAPALLEIVKREGVDVYVPVCAPAASLPDARAEELLAPWCEVLHLQPDQVEMLDDKYAFSQAAVALGLSVPDSHRITDPQQVLDFDFSRSERPYILKSIAYDPVHRLDLTPLPFGPAEQMAAWVRALPISEDNPWIMQEFIEGQEYCTHSTVRDGSLRVYCCCVSSSFQINYEMSDVPEIRDWVERFVAAERLTGQVSFDFIRAEDGSVHAIECNPRTHSAITMLYDHDGVAPAYLDDAWTGPVVVPTVASRPTYWIYHELYRLLAEPGRAGRLRTILAGKDAIFDRDDPLPFLVEHQVQIPWLLLQSLLHRTAWIRIDINIGKLVEPAGD
jgi:predicted ATP-grasp superfamily ATP-dependent carboligase